jgi:hypothetical protein
LKYQAPLPRPSRADGTALPALLAAVLAAMVALQFVLPQEESRSAVPHRSVVRRTVTGGPSLSIADPILLRDALFAPARGRGKSAGAGPLDGAVFVGVVRGRGFARAVLQEADGGAASVSLGGKYHGWKLVSLDDANAVFIRDGIRHSAPIARGAIASAPSFQPRLPYEQ